MHVFYRDGLQKLGDLAWKWHMSTIITMDVGMLTLDG
jgi:hypothetical protein